MNRMELDSFCAENGGHCPQNISRVRLANVLHRSSAHIQDIAYQERQEQNCHPQSAVCAAKVQKIYMSLSRSE
ncbi:MAG: hypothetical protein NC122_04955 [Faecalibacterium sp.]|nr:hypothetical protein [Ruminococcus sp.]MCM1391890.1 hypothetical protein [Ruminococcus sp.]MCM1485534.1 hypothetical protein [Faecalibacterium sp.]